MNEEVELTEEEKQAKKEKKIFIARIILFCLFGCAIPFVFIGWRYDIFRVQQDVSPRVSLTGWGFLALIIVFFFVKYCLNVLKQSIPYSMTYQIISGFVKVLLPLIMIYVAVNGIKNNVNLFQQALLITIISEAVAIVVNPFPKYMHEKGIEYTSNLMDIFIDKVKKAKGGNE